MKYPPLLDAYPPPINTPSWAPVVPTFLKNVGASAVNNPPLLYEVIVSPLAFLVIVFSSPLVKSPPIIPANPASIAWLPNHEIPLTTYGFDATFGFDNIFPATQLVPAVPYSNTFASASKYDWAANVAASSGLVIPHFKAESPTINNAASDFFLTPALGSFQTSSASFISLLNLSSDKDDPVNGLLCNIFENDAPKSEYAPYWDSVLPISFPSCDAVSLFWAPSLAAHPKGPGIYCIVLFPPDWVPLFNVSYKLNPNISVTLPSDRVNPPTVSTDFSPKFVIELNTSFGFVEFKTS